MTCIVGYKFDTFLLCWKFDNNGENVKNNNKIINTWIIKYPQWPLMYPNDTRINSNDTTMYFRKLSSPIITQPQRYPIAPYETYPSRPLRNPNTCIPYLNLFILICNLKIQINGKKKIFSNLLRNYTVKFWLIIV